MKIYVGSLSYDVTEEELRQEFLVFGKVESVSIITDKYSGRPKGFAFAVISEVIMNNKYIGSGQTSDMDLLKWPRNLKAKPQLPASKVKD